MNPEFGGFSPEQRFIKVPVNEAYFEEDGKTLTTDIAVNDTIIALYDPASQTGYLGRFNDPESKKHDIYNLLISARNFSSEYTSIKCWALEVDQEFSDNEPLEAQLDCTEVSFAIVKQNNDNTRTVVAVPIEPATDIYTKIS